MTADELLVDSTVDATVDTAALWREIDDLDRRRFERPRIRSNLLDDAQRSGDQALVASTLLVLASDHLMDDEFERFETVMVELESILASDKGLIDRLAPGRSRLSNRRSLLAEMVGRGIEHWHHILDAYEASSSDVLSVGHLRDTVNMLDAEYERGCIERVGRFDLIMGSWPVGSAHARAHRGIVGARLAGLDGDWRSAERFALDAVKIAGHTLQFPRHEARIELIQAYLETGQLDRAEATISDLESLPATTYHSGYPNLFRSQVALRRGELDLAGELLVQLRSNVKLAYAGELAQRTTAAEAELALAHRSYPYALSLIEPLLTNETTMAGYHRGVHVGLRAARASGHVTAELDLARRAAALAQSKPRWELDADTAARLDRAMQQSATGSLESEGQDRQLTTRRIRHDLMSVVNAIQLHVEMFRETNGAHSLEAVGPALNLVNEMADQLSLFSSLRGGLVVPEPVIVDLSSLVVELVELNRQAASSRDLTLAVAMPSSPPVLTLIDRGLLTRMVNNVITNAVKYAPSGGTVSVSLDVTRQGRSDYPTVEVAISDDGPGLSEVVRWRLTGEGSDVPSPVKGDGGLGLYIVRRAAQLLDIRITATESVLGGTRVALVIPVGLGAIPQGDKMKADEHVRHT